MAFEIDSAVFDLDDTLLHDDLTVSDYTVRVLQELHKAGVRIIIASGRAQQSMKPYVEQMACVSAYISCNGAEIWEGLSHRCICRELLPVDTCVEIACFAERHGCYAHTYDKGCFFYNSAGKYAAIYATATKLKGVHVGKLSSFIREPRNKILMIDDDEKIASMYQEAQKLFRGRASVTCSKPCYLEFNPPGASKGNALQTLSHYLDFDLKRTIAFGDSLNDLSMFQQTGISVIVSNGWKEVRNCCDDVCGSNNQDGPAHYLDTCFLHGGCLFDLSQGF